jgi:O-antigen/teichoic acid export membrane protein
MNRDRAIARNTGWNFIGSTLPLIAAVFSIPLLIRGLGTERFGVLTLAWTITGYFALFDFGLGRATTKFVAEYIARGVLKELPQLVWSSLTAHLILGLMGGTILALLTPWLAGGFFKIPAELVREVRITFYLLALSVPLLVATACLRGLLEAVHRFDLVNLIRIPAGILNYAGPLVVVWYTDNLIAVVGFIVVSRAVVLGVNAWMGFRHLPVSVGHYAFAANLLRPLLGFGGWLTASSLIGTSIVFIDRFVIGALVSMSAVAYYATPYEIVTKLWIFSASLLGALFPVVSALSVVPGNEIRHLYGRASRYLLVSVTPLTGLLLTFAEDLLGVWIDAEFARQSAGVAKWLAIGVLINVIAQVPFTVLQGMGKAGNAARIQLAQLPFYVPALWYLTAEFGVRGAAIAWTVRAMVDFLLLAHAANRAMPGASAALRGLTLSQGAIAGAALAGFWLIDITFTGELVVKLVAFGIILSFLIAWEWAFVLDAGDRSSMLNASRQAHLFSGRNSK